jgi:hypothetical protein
VGSGESSNRRVHSMISGGFMIISTAQSQFSRWSPVIWSPITMCGSARITIMLVFGRALPILGLGDLRVAVGFVAGLDGAGFGWVAWLGAPVDLSSSSSLSWSPSSCWSKVSRTS